MNLLQVLSTTHVLNTDVPVIFGHPLSPSRTHNARFSNNFRSNLNFLSRHHPETHHRPSYTSLSITAFLYKLTTKARRCCPATTFPNCISSFFALSQPLSVSSASSISQSPFSGSRLFCSMIRTFWQNKTVCWTSQSLMQVDIGFGQVVPVVGSHGQLGCYEGEGGEDGGTNLGCMAIMC